MITCDICNDLLGPLAEGEVQHKFCRWAKPEDWRALEPWFNGSLRGVSAGGA